MGLNLLAKNTNKKTAKGNKKRPAEKVVEEILSEEEEEVVAPAPIAKKAKKAKHTPVSAVDESESESNSNDEADNSKKSSSGILVAVKKNPSEFLTIDNIGRTVLVGGSKNKKSEQQLNTLLTEAAGPIESIHLISDTTRGNYMVVFKKAKSVDTVLTEEVKINNEKLFITKVQPLKYEEFRGNAVTIANFKKTTEADIINHFAKCGKICFILLNQQVGKSIGTILFKDVSSVANALALNGKDFNGEPLSVQGRCLVVSNLPLDCTEKQVEDLFGKCGKISSISIQSYDTYNASKARITFEDNKSYALAVDVKASFNEKRIFVFETLAGKPKKGNNKLNAKELGLLKRIEGKLKSSNEKSKQFKKFGANKKNFGNKQFKKNFKKPVVKS